MNGLRSGRQPYVRPIVLAVVGALTAEMGLFVLYGLILYPGGSVIAKLAWTVTCGVGIGSVVGAFVNLFVTGRFVGQTAAICSAILAFAVALYCIGLCYFIDRRFNYFGASSDPVDFFVGGVLPAAILGVTYGWLLHMPRGQATLARLGL